MARANPFDPKVSSVSSVLYCTPTDASNAFIYGYPVTQAVTALSPKGVVCKPGTLQTSPTTWP